MVFLPIPSLRRGEGTFMSKYLEPRSIKQRQDTTYAHAPEGSELADILSSLIAKI